MAAHSPAVQTVRLSERWEKECGMWDEWECGMWEKIVICGEKIVEMRRNHIR